MSNKKLESWHKSSVRSASYYFGGFLIGLCNLRIANAPSDVINAKGFATLKGAIVSYPAIDCLNGGACNVFIHKKKLAEKNAIARK